jgi:hypothetical protein
VRSIVNPARPSCRGAACVIPAGNGLETTTDGGATWRLLRSAPTDLVDVSCPTARLCVGVRADGTGVVSADGGRRWRSRRATREVRFRAVDCPSASLCVAGGMLGGRLGIIRNPARRSARFVVTRLGSAPAPGRPGNPNTSIGIDGISCPSARLCVAIDWFGRVATSTRPAGGRRDWKIGVLKGFSGQATSGSAAIDCPSVRLCVAADAKGATAYTTNPAAGASSWKTSPGAFAPAGTAAASVGCAGAFCLLAYGGQLLTFTATPR